MYEPAARAGASPAGSYIVRARPGAVDQVAASLAGLGGRVGRRIAIIDAVTVQLPAGAAQALRADPRVASVTADTAVHMLSAGYDPRQDVNSMYSLGSMVGSRGWWSNHTGAGVDVALVDSGVTPVLGLSDSGKILNGPDLTPESQDPSTRYVDTYGHGTHLAGIIAGHDPGVDPAVNQNNSTAFLGVAPGARIVSVKVADANGNSDVSQVIAGIDWVVQHAHDPGVNIRVLNLSFGTNSTQAYTVDPLAYAVEVAWRAGIVVVTSAGNSGAADGRLTNPADDPFVVAVGADDLNGTASNTDDTIPAFSSIGDGKRNPDLVAPGAHIQSLRVPGSHIDTQYAGTGAIDGRFFRGSGTSQAAAFVSGSVALLLQKSPSLTPDQVKAILTSTSAQLKKAHAQAQGKGLLDLKKMLAAKTPGASTQKAAPSTGTGSLEGSRGDAHLIMNGITLSGDVDINGQPFDAARMAAAEAAGSSWAAGTWNGKSWAGSSWAGSSWAGSSWAGKSWAGSSWAGSSWAGSSWAGKSWADSGWS
jgi:serine protease AprX